MPTSDWYELKTNTTFAWPLTVTQKGKERVSLDLVGDRGIWVRLYSPDDVFLQQMMLNGIVWEIDLDLDTQNQQTYVRGCLHIKQGNEPIKSILFPIELSELDILSDHFRAMTKVVLLAIHADTNSIEWMETKDTSDAALRSLEQAYQSSQSNLAYHRHYYDWYGAFTESFESKIKLIKT